LSLSKAKSSLASKKYSFLNFIANEKPSPSFKFVTFFALLNKLIAVFQTIIFDAALIFEPFVSFFIISLEIIAIALSFFNSLKIKLKV